MTNIIPFLWFDNQAEEVANFYVDLFDNSSILSTDNYQTDTPSDKKIGSVMTVRFELEGMRFVALNGGNTDFQINPSISFMVRCNSKGEVEKLWKELSEDSQVLMPLSSYPFNECFGWLQDKFNVSWQLMVEPIEPEDQKIIPSLLFVGDNFGKASEALDLYQSIFDLKIHNTLHYSDQEGTEVAGKIKKARFSINQLLMGCTESNLDHKFNFNEAISFMVECKDQDEIDHYWNNLSADPSAERCGWLKDKFGISWQIIPEKIYELMDHKNKGKQVADAILDMKKIDLQKLENLAN